MNKHIRNLFMIFVIGLCLSLPLTVSANAEPGTNGPEPISTPTDQCTNTTQKTPTSTVTTEDGQTTDTQTQDSTNNGCTEWQTAPVSWNS